jgi:SET domain-containing protein
VISDVEVRPAGPKGLGLYARRPFAKGEFIFRRRNGRPMRYEDLASVPEERREHLTELDRERCAIVLPPGCYLNHSCEPNAMRSGVKVFAWRDIASGEEIAIDYRLNAFEGDRWPCLCGARSCTGMVVGSFFALSEATQQAYLPFAPAFIQREWRERAAKA